MDSNIIRISNINKYRIEIINNELIATPIEEVVITEDEFINKNFTNSKIKKCLINDDINKITDKLNYFSILIDIYKSLSTSFIIQNTTFNIKIGDEKGAKGYHYDKSLNLSIQRKDANATIKEIIKMININNYKINIEIELENKELINYKN
uniref:Uncharacterized protein n=1 Tax=viral metagenome TaxID=1070528 RepID=A0A6C0DNC9_9ZZZZ